MPSKTGTRGRGKALRVLVVDNTSLTGQLIAEALRKDRRLSVTSVTGTTVLESAFTLKPQVIILSETLEGIPGRGLAVLKELQAAMPQTRVVMLLDVAQREMVVQAFRNGARGVFCRSDSLPMLTRCVHRVHDGQLWISGSQFEYLLETLDAAPPARLVDAQGTLLLSKREQDVTRCLAVGLTNREIAREMKISENTVKSYIFRVFNKLGVSSRMEVVLYATKQGHTHRITRQTFKGRSTSHTADERSLER